MPIRAACLALGVAVGLLASCGGAAPSGPAAWSGRQGCEPSHLDVCERTLVETLAEGRPVGDLVTAYVQARAARDEDDAWVRLWRDLRAGDPKTARPLVAVVSEGRAAEPARRAATALGPLARFAASPETLPKPAAARREIVLLALVAAAGYEHAFVTTADGEAFQLFPNDPLEPFLAGLPAVVRGDRSLARMRADVDLASAIRRAVGAAGGVRYVDAAREADRLSALLANREDASETTLRARYALTLLGSAGIALEAKDSSPRSGERTTPSSGDTPYGDFLRVRTAPDEHAEWRLRRGKILPAVIADRRAALDALFANAGARGPRGVRRWERPGTHDAGPACDAAAAPPPMEGVRDLVFGWALADAFSRDPVSGPGSGKAPALTPAQWLHRYDAMVRTISQSRSAWAYVPMLLAERGQLFGASARATGTYRRVSQMGESHVRALRELQEAQPARFRALAALPLVYSPGVATDDRLRSEVVTLMQASVQENLASATDASGVFDALVAGTFAGASYPPAIQEAHYLALQAAFAAKLRGELTSRTGWGVAGLYASDLAYRLLTDRTPNAAFSTAQIVRALDHDADLTMKPLGALATSAARYVALGIGGQLDLNQRPERYPPERRDARAALRKAIAGLGASGEAPNNVLDDMTELADGMIAATTRAIAGARKAPPKTCPSKTREVGPTPEVRRALGRLGDVRQRILSHPRYRQGDGVWIRRARLLVTLLSDAFDLHFLKKGTTLEFTVPNAEAQKAITDGLRDLDDRETADAIAGAHALARGYFTAKAPGDLLARHGPDVRRVLGGILASLRGGTSGRGSGVALLDSIASIRTEGSQAADLPTLLARYAQAFFEQQQPDHGDLSLLGLVATSALTQTDPPKQAVDVAARSGSRVEWALRFLGEVGKLKRGELPDPAAYASGMRRARDATCATADVDEVVAVMGAVRDFARGRRKEARAALDRVLESADTRGLAVPRLFYKYEEKTSTKIFGLSLGVSYGAGLLEGANAFQLGLGVKSKGPPEGSLTVSFDPPDSRQTAEDSARYYVHVAALAAAYHFLDGDPAAATAAAGRAIGATVGGVRLGAVRIQKEGSAAWGTDARAVLAIDAELAAEAGLPFLAGDLWTVVRGTLAPDASDESVRGILRPLPAGLAAIDGIQRVADRADRGLQALAAKLPCTEQKVELGRYEEPACEDYPLALSLRVADALTKLPRLRREGGAATTPPKCAPLRAVDKFLGALDKGTYDPDLLTKAALELRADGRLYDAAVLLSRQRRETHCSPALVTLARALGRSPALERGMRADLLSVAVNCSVAAVDGPFVEDLLALDETTRALPDLGRNLRVVLSIADLALHADRWDVLAKLTAEPSFVERWLTVSATAATAALGLDHAAAILSEASVATQRTRASYDLLCAALPSDDRASLCARIAALRAASKVSAADRKRDAKELVKSVVASAAAKP